MIRYDSLWFVAADSFGHHVPCDDVPCNKCWHGHPGPCIRESLHWRFHGQAAWFPLWSWLHSYGNTSSNTYARTRNVINICGTYTYYMYVRLYTVHIYIYIYIWNINRQIIECNWQMAIGTRYARSFSVCRVFLLYRTKCYASLPALSHIYLAVSFCSLVYVSHC